jgi:hypothetical protein
MPSVSRSQQRLMQAASHGADFAKAKEVRASMSAEDLHDFASGSMKGKPEHAKKPAPAKRDVESHRWTKQQQRRKA